MTDINDYLKLLFARLSELRCPDCSEPVRRDSAGDVLEFLHEQAADFPALIVVPIMIGSLAETGKLGLAGMQERARLLGGSVTLESAPGEGTVVTVEAPV